MSKPMEGAMDGTQDETLVVRARAGETDAFAELARLHRERVYAVVFGLVRNHADADDLAQETFMAAYRAIGRFRGGSSFSTWLYRIAVNLTMNHLKKRKREKGRSELLENTPPSAEARAAASPEVRAQTDEISGKIAAALAEIPIPFQAAFQLVVNQGLSHARAAEVLGCSESTVSWRMHKARKLLQARLAPFLSEVRP
ncbi:MAG: sigma-70 family RNA polymerase sigma factor [Candidatus Aminicenantes bacterium]|nr:sigma-70 family RNA polymerase sigma factor [Candidatus Aminicenantes bacterium]